MTPRRDADKLYLQAAECEAAIRSYAAITQQQARDFETATLTEEKEYYQHIAALHIQNAIWLNEQIIASQQTTLRQKTWWQKVKEKFDMHKKIIDSFDDVMRALGDLDARVSEMAVGIVIAVGGFFVHCGELLIATVAVRDVYQDESITAQRKTRIVTNVAAAFLAGTGLGFSVVYLLENVGAFALASTLSATLPFLIPALLTSVYVLAFWREFYIFQQAEKAEETARVRYEAALGKDSLIDLTEELKAIQIKIAEIQALKSELIEPLENNANIIEQVQRHTKELCYRRQLIELKTQEQELFTKINRIHAAQKNYLVCYEAHALAREKAILAAAELTFSLFISVSAALTVTAFVGAATFGAVPAVLVIIGVVGGFAVKKWGPGLVRRFFSAALSTAERPEVELEESVRIATRGNSHTRITSLLPALDPQSQTVPSSPAHSIDSSSSFGDTGLDDRLFSQDLSQNSQQQEKIQTPNPEQEETQTPDPEQEETQALLPASRPA